MPRRGGEGQDLEVLPPDSGDAPESVSHAVDDNDAVQRPIRWRRAAVVALTAVVVVGIGRAAYGWAGTWAVRRLDRTWARAVAVD